MSNECYDYSAIAGCHTDANNLQLSVVLHYYTDYDGQPAVRITDTVGNIIAGADESNTTPGACLINSVESQFLIYLERNAGVITMADIVANSGARTVHSVTVKQMSGQGEIQGDSGSGVPMDAGETWSWSAVSDLNTDHLSASQLSMNAGSGEQRITATYIR